MNKRIYLSLLAFLLGFVLTLNAQGQDNKGKGGSQTRPDNTKAKDKKMETAIFAAGCFWGVEADFQKLKGVASTEVGYTGGHTQDPSYQQVCTDTTGHAEAIRLTYDPAVISYDDLLKVFWENHNPTTPNRQGPDVGSQYRSAVFYTTPEQQKAALASKEKLDRSDKYSRPIVTEITKAGEFYRAEEYHQQYYRKKGGGSCKF
ncbi:MAG: peptide-methionine (S)-S-oxide reductase MsrA [Candidatus Edwardsbacteria bacterium]|nr:peptide-methionine (S)-S-oxide reductase MsrA [Candidatus Edwardsbacteria bacterium]